MEYLINNHPMCEIEELEVSDISSESLPKIPSEIEFDCENTEIQSKDILSVDIGNDPDECVITVTVLVQRRKHKKKRINKKWIKRYGYDLKRISVMGKIKRNYERSSLVFEANSIE